MPVFIPVNPPPASEEVGMDAPDNNAPEDMLLRVEEQVPNIERECSAYCNEYGGMDIERLRTSVFMNAGRLYALSNGGPDLYVGLEELERLDLARPRALSALCDESVLRGSLDFFIKALRFEIHPGQNTISLELLGSGILEFYDRHISEAACSNSSNPFAHVEYRIDQAKPSDTLMHKPQLQKPYELDSVLDANIVCSEPVAVDAKNIDINVADALGAIDKTANIITDNATTSNDKVNPEDNLAASAGDSSNNESSRGVKRQGSLSEDEMPVKRRSTRFSERTTSSLECKDSASTQ
ncbi:hypothetical protein IW140_000560 [Coemansia sp. RSA 1813]|nr:hypothetical protein IW140_000560 [Coemansia sp. RSA 1813]